MRQVVKVEPALESADGTGAGHETDTEEAQFGVQGEGGVAAIRGDRTITERASEFGVHPNQICNWKKQLLEGAVSVFEGGASAEGAASEAQVDLLYRQIGRLKVEADCVPPPLEMGGSTIGRYI